MKKWDDTTDAAQTICRALRRPFSHIAYSFMTSLALPWPIGHHPIGLRHAALNPPNQTTEAMGASVKDSIWSTVLYRRQNTNNNSGLSSTPTPADEDIADSGVIQQ